MSYLNEATVGGTPSSFLDTIHEDGAGASDLGSSMMMSSNMDSSVSGTPRSSNLKRWWDVMTLRSRSPSFNDNNSYGRAPSSTRGVEAGHGGDSLVSYESDEGGAELVYDSRTGRTSQIPTRQRQSAHVVSRRIVLPPSPNRAAAAEAAVLPNNDKRRFSWQLVVVLVILIAGVAIGIYFIADRVGGDDNSSPGLEAPPPPASPAGPPNKATMAPSLISLPTAPSTAFTTVPTTEGDLQETELFLLSLSDPDTINDPNSPQARAMDWFLYQDGAHVTVSQHGEERCKQRYVLGLLYHSLNGQNWLERDGWTTPLHECSWSGIECSDNMTTVVGIERSGQNLVGSIVSEVGWLESLQQISWFNNTLIGSLPDEFWDLSSLNWIDLSENALTGTLSSDVWDLPFLEFLYLSENNMKGTFPEIPRVTMVQQIWLQDNIMSGPLPESLYLLESLESLVLYGNSFDSQLPQTWSTMTSLEYLDLSFNAFTGLIPSDLYFCTAIRYLYLDDNQLSGELDAAIRRMTVLEEAWFNTNQLSGFIPNAFGQLGNMTMLLLHDNLLSGAVPDTVCDLFVTGVLERLEADCNDTAADKYVACACCTLCH